MQDGVALGDHIWSQHVRTLELHVVQTVAVSNVQAAGYNKKQTNHIVVERRGGREEWVGGCWRTGWGNGPLEATPPSSLNACTFP